MDNEKILERLTPIFQDIFDDDEIVVTNDLSAKDVDDWDSFAQIRLVAAIEKDFKIKFTFNELAALKNVGDMTDLILAKIKES